MAFRNSQQARVYIGLLGASAYTRSVSVQGNAGMVDVTTIADTAKAFIPGQSSATFQIAGPLDTDATANAQFDALTDLIGATSPTAITYMPLGTDGHAWLLSADSTEFANDTTLTGSADWSMSAQVTGQFDARGVILSNNATVTGDGDSAIVDNAAATSNGAVAHLHVTAYSGLTSDDITIEASTTGAWGGEETTLFTFTQVAGLTSQRLTVTGSVPRYLRVVDDVTGTGSITRTVAVSRR